MWLHRDREAVCAQKIADALGSPGDHGGLGIGSEIDQNFLIARRLWCLPCIFFQCAVTIGDPLSNLMRRFAQRQFAQCHESGLTKEIL